MIRTAMTKPKMTMVSGMATKIIKVPPVSGFSAIAPAPAEPILDCAQAVAMAGTAMAKAAAKAINAVVISSPLSD